VARIRREIAEPEAPEAQSIEDVLAASGVNVTEAKANIAKLKVAFSKGKGGIAEGALLPVVGALRDQSGAFWLALCRRWESEA